MDEQSKKISSPQKLSKDTNYNNQPKGTSPFILNAVEESIEGDMGGLTNETGNEKAHLFPQGFIPLHSISINNKKTAVFLADGINSIIATIDQDDNFDIYLDDRGQSEKVGFSLDFQIDAEFRLRRGCESTLYWVDPKPRKFVLERPDKFKNEDGTWNIASFELQRRIEKIPFINDIEVISSGGRLKSGSYIASVQYLDYDFNSTEFVASSRPVRIYSDNVTSKYSEIRGSSQEETGLYKPEPDTGKSIKISLTNVDTNYPFYRLAISEINTGAGTISRVVKTKEMSTSNTEFVYTGANYAEEGTIAEVQIQSSYVEEAKNIDQVDNMLMLSNTKGTSADLSELQKYASRIQTDLVTKRVKVNSPEGANPKNPTASIEGLGYMPGEIYAQAIFYILEGNFVTPGFHIPGKNPNLQDSTKFTTGENVYGMSTNNQSGTDRYIDNSSCSFNYWGKDSQGDDLLGQPLRHHRFPLRSDIGKPLVEKVESESISFENNNPGETFEFIVTGDPDLNSSPSPGLGYDLFYKELDSSGSPTGNEIVKTMPFLFYENYYGEKISYSDTIKSDYGITPIRVQEQDAGTTTQISLDNDNKGTSTTSSLDIEVNVIEGGVKTLDDPVYETEVFGLKFSNVVIPPKEVIGKKVIGYFFGRAERQDENKTVVDTGVVGPCMKNLSTNDSNRSSLLGNSSEVEGNVNEKFISHSFLFPEISVGYSKRINDKYLYLINPEHKFNNKKPSNFSEVIQEGSIDVLDRKTSAFYVQDVNDLSTYDPEIHKRSDNDGWNLHTRLKQNLVEFNPSSNKTLFKEEDIKKVSYYNALENDIVDRKEFKQFINLSADNTVGLIELEQSFTESTENSLPYVVLKRSLANPYSNYRSISYIKTTNNYHIAGSENSVETQEEFGGDTYVSSMAYTSTVFYRAKPKKRTAKGGTLEKIGGAIVAAVGVVLIATGVGAAIGASLIGIGASLYASGIRADSVKKVYEEMYKDGLRETVVDRFMSGFDSKPFNGDDEYQWGAELTPLFFESSVNIGLRHGANVGSITDFMSSPPIIESGNNDLVKYKPDNPSTSKPKTNFDNYILEKLTVFNENRKEKKEYLGVPKAEIYEVNKDYLFQGSQKKYEHLPIEYDACSDCKETFDKRIYYSLQSFNEELTDNFGVFLPNNYKDIQGDTGSITDVFTIKNNIYIVTEHALWHLPQTYQERVTNDIVSFIGTGGYFAQPPRKIVDDEIDSAGTSFKQAIEKTRHGVMIVSEKENKVYLFDGQQLQPISQAGMSNFFNSYLDINVNKQYYRQNKKSYPYLDNPSHPIGAGFISVYDDSKSRFILTKKDFKLNSIIDKQDFKLKYCNGQTILFDNISQTIAQKESQDFNCAGVENCQLKFVKDKQVQQQQTVTEVVQNTVTNNTVLVIWLDTSGSFDNAARSSIVNVVLNWRKTFMTNNNWSGETFIFGINQSDIPSKYDTTNISTLNNLSGPQTETWLNCLNYFSTNYTPGISGKDILMVNFVNEASSDYHVSTLESSISSPTDSSSSTSVSSWTNDYNTFISVYNSLISSGGSFKGLLYPVVSSSASNTKSFLQNSVAAIKPGNLDPNTLVKNPAFTTTEWNSFINSYLTSPNLYITNNVGLLSDYSWDISTDNQWDGTNDPISQSKFNSDIGSFLEGVSTVQENQVTQSVTIIEKEYSYIPGKAVTLNNMDYSYTLSYSLKSKAWISFHSYTPSFYLKESTTFYSWIPESQYMWRHLTKGLYNNFYEIKRPFIIEVVSNENKISTKIWEDILFQTNASVYDTSSEEFLRVKETFNKILFYNSYQISGEQNLLKKEDDGDYMGNQIQENDNGIILDRNEEDYSVNDIRDYRKDLSLPMFIKNVEQLQDNYFIDKKVNTNNIDPDKPWYDLELMRDKYLVIRFIFDNFDDTKLTMLFSYEDARKSEK